MSELDNSTPDPEHSPGGRSRAGRTGAAGTDAFSFDGAQFELQLLKQAIDRTEAIVRDETSALRRGELVDLHEFSSRKSHQLLALNRAFDAARGVSGTEHMVKEMDQLRQTLAENAALLRTRLTAVQEVADIISSVMRQAESDGTYSRPISAGGAR